MRDELGLEGADHRVVPGSARAVVRPGRLVTGFAPDVSMLEVATTETLGIYNDKNQVDHDHGNATVGYDGAL